jgi:hypothetical protein
VVDPAWHRAMREAVDRGWNVPIGWLSVTFRVTDPEDAMQIRYLFHPWNIRDPKPPESAAWRRIQADRLAIWMEAITPAIAAGFRDRLGSRVDAILPNPEDPPRADPAPNGNQAAPDPSMLDMLTGRLSYRMLTPLADFGVLWVYLGNAMTASTIASLRLLSQGISSVAQDYLRSVLGPTILKQDLPGIGTESPLPR